MATDQSTQSFGRVSRLRGQVFEALTLAASVTGILALAILLAYVSIDAFELDAASPEWLFTYLGTLVLPYVGFCLYSIDDRAATRRILGALVGGFLVVAVAFTAIEALVRPIPRLEWHLVGLFVVVIPVVGYVTVRASQGAVGAVGFGLVGRALGGGALGLWLFVVFVVFEPQLWLLVYTLSLLPAAGLYALGRWRSAGLPAALALPAGVLGLVAAFLIHSRVDVYPTPLFIYGWTLALPVTLGAGVLTARRDDRRAGGLVVAGILAVVLGGTVLLWQVGGFTGGAVLLLLVGLAVPAVTFVHRVVRDRRGLLGLALPLLLVAGVLVGTLLVDLLGMPAPDPWLDLSYVQGTPTTQVTQAREAGLYPAIVGSVIIISLVAVLSFVLGVGTAVFLEEYTADTGVVGAITRLLQVNIANLAAVPSVVYGLLGLGLFVNLLGFGFGTAVSASLTLSLLILPITVISAQEAIRSVPNSLRDGSYAMGATRWQTTKNVVLPEAMPGIFTGIILALGRAIGETAPLIMVGMATIAFNAPNSIWSRFSAMPMMIFTWADNPSAEFRFGVVAAGVITLLAVLVAMNATAIIIRNRYERGP